MIELKVLYKAGNYLASEDLSRIYIYDGWAKTPAAAKFRKIGFSGSCGSFGGRNICLGIDPQGNKIMSDGVWYWCDGVSERTKKYIKESIKKQKEEQ